MPIAAPRKMVKMPDRNPAVLIGSQAGSRVQWRCGSTTMTIASTSAGNLVNACSTREL